MKREILDAMSKWKILLFGGYAIRLNLRPD